jgi:hypothetical protein
MIQCGYIVLALLNSATSFVSGELGRRQQEKLARKSQELNQQLEENRQSFQLDIHLKNVEAQKNLSMLNYDLRLKEQQINFENTCKSAEWQKFLSTWPLITVPSVIREQQINRTNSTVSLRVFLSKSNNRLFNESVYPEVEQSLKDFTDNYINVFNANNIIYYHNAWIGSVQGGAVNENLYFALKELPTLIVDTNIVSDKLYVGLTVWGFGTDEKKQMTVFTIPFEQRVINNKIDKEYYSNLSSQIIDYLKFIIGYTYDTYNLIQYDNAPLLPKVIEYEKTVYNHNILFNNELDVSYKIRYGELYNYVLGGLSYNTANKAYDIKDLKKTYLHILRLEFAIASRSSIEPSKYLDYLQESLDAWVSIRSTINSANFLEKISWNKEELFKYCTKEDLAYFEKILSAYNGTNADVHIISKIANTLNENNLKNSSNRNQLIQSDRHRGRYLESGEQDIFKL